MKRARTDVVGYRDLYVPGPRDVMTVARALKARGLADVHLVYLDHDTEEVRIAAGALARVTVSSEHVTVTSAALGVDEARPARDPFVQVGEALERLPLARWTAYGYLAFDLARFYYPYAKAIAQPLLSLIIPETEIRLTRHGASILTSRGVKAVAEAVQSTGGQEPSLPRPAALMPTPADREAYEARVAAAIDAIKRGELRKAILSRRLKIDGRLDALATYRAALEGNHAARSYCFELGEVKGVGFSPELFLEADAEGRVVTNPLAGTRPRGDSVKDDAALREELFDDPKEVKEHALSILLAQEELRGVCEPTTVRVHDFMEVKRFRCVQHLSSRVGGVLDGRRTTWDAIKVLFPGITVSGIDKAAALRIIDGHEDEPRGVYGGAVGWIGSEGQADLAIAIRSVYEYAGVVCINAGAGVVAESSPDREYLESAHKMNTMISRVALQGS